MVRKQSGRGTAFIILSLALVTMPAQASESSPSNASVLRYLRRRLGQPLGPHDRERARALKRFKRGDGTLRPDYSELPAARQESARRKEKENSVRQRSEHLARLLGMKVYQDVIQDARQLRFVAPRLANLRDEKLLDIVEHAIERAKRIEPDPQNLDWTRQLQRQTIAEDIAEHASYLDAVILDELGIREKKGVQSLNSAEFGEDAADYEDNRFSRRESDADRARKWLKSDRDGFRADLLKWVVAKMPGEAESVEYFTQAHPVASALAMVEAEVAIEHLVSSAWEVSSETMVEEAGAEFVRAFKRAREREAARVASSVAASALALK